MLDCFTGLKLFSVTLKFGMQKNNPNNTYIVMPPSEQQETNTLSHHDTPTVNTNTINNTPKHVYRYHELQSLTPAINKA